MTQGKVQQEINNFNNFLPNFINNDLYLYIRKQLCETYAGVLNKCIEFDYLKCTVIKVREPLVLKENENVLSSWINSS